MPEGSGVGGFPVMEPVEQSTTGKQRGVEMGGQGHGMRKQDGGNGG